jgi:hypothetical protein
VRVTGPTGAFYSGAGGPGVLLPGISQAGGPALVSQLSRRLRLGEMFGRQLAGRCELICTGAFPYRPEWAQLIAALEATLRLHRHEPGTLPAQAKYLHQRTGGMIGSLTHLIRGAAIRAILDGQEAITRPLLDTARIDHAAESATRRASSTR